MTDPEGRELTWLQNYSVVLTDQLWWQSVFVAVFVMVIHRIVFARGVVRTSILIPYGIITVVSAYAWLFAFQTGTGSSTSGCTWERTRTGSAGSGARSS